MRTATLTALLAVVSPGFHAVAGDMVGGPSVGVYVSPVDGSEQSYGLYAPPDSGSGAPYPLVVVLDGQPSALTPGTQGRYARAARASGCLLMQLPAIAGRLNGEMGMADTVAAVEDLARRESVDPDRVYLVGVDEGWSAAWQLACLQPDRWAALALAGNATPECATALCRRHHGPDLLSCAVNLLHVPVLLALRDPPGTGYRESVEAALASARIEAATNLVAAAEEAFEQALCRWLRGHTRGGAPTRVHFRAPGLNCGRSYWAEIQEMKAPGRFAELKAWMEGPSTLRVRCGNVRKFALDLDAGFIEAPGPVEVFINDFIEPLRCAERRTYAFEAADAAGAAWSEAGGDWPGLYKRAGREGPICRFFNSPFVVVKCSSVRKDVENAVAGVAADLADSWRRYRGADPRVIHEAELSDETVDSLNVVVVGVPSATNLANRIQVAMPVCLVNGRARLGRETIKAPNLGIRAVYPNPLNSDRLVLVLSANSARALERAWSNAGFESDWEVYTVSKEGLETTLARGLFDARWQVATPGPDHDFSMRRNR